MKKIGVLGLMAALAVTGAVAFLPKGVMAAEDSDQTISQGVYIGDVDVSGMTQEEAKKAVEDDMSEAKAANITLKVDDQETVVSAGDLGLSWANEEVVQEAAELGKSGNIIKRYKDKKDLENESRKYDIDYFVDRSSIHRPFIWRDRKRKNPGLYAADPESSGGKRRCLQPGTDRCTAFYGKWCF